MKRITEVKKLLLSRETLLKLAEPGPIAADGDETSNQTGKACCKCA